MLIQLLKQLLQKLKSNSIVNKLSFKDLKQLLKRCKKNSMMPGMPSIEEIKTLNSTDKLKKERKNTTKCKLLSLNPMLSLLNL